MKKRPSGFSLVEVVIASLLLSIVIMATMKAFRFISVQSVRTDERAFATQKALQMMEELRATISDSATTVAPLDAYSNGLQFKYTLSTLPEVNGSASVADPGDRPEDPISGNVFQKGRWKYKRKITVLPIMNEELARRVFVRVYRNDADGELLAETMSVLRCIRNQLYPTQVFDVYVLALENVPGWWVSLSTIRPMFDNVVTDLQVRNPGLQFRVHYITRLAYGRDPHYTPYTNDAAPADTPAGEPRGVYFYPGLVDKPNVGNFLYYVPDSMEGRRNVDGVLTAPSGYSMADQYNHAVRYPDEEALYAAAVAQAQAAGTQPPEISYRMLIERMATSPAVDASGTVLWDYRNSIVFNLHGELMPLPPMRNYSDPAKDPVAYPSLASGYPRAVTHPDRLQYPTTSEVRLRVYTYCERPFGADNSPGGGGGNADVPHSTTLSRVTVVIKSTSIVPADVFKIRKCQGHAVADYSWVAAVEGPDYSIDSSVPGQLAVTIKDSPLRHGKNVSERGMDDILHGYEYAPSPLGGPSFAEGSRDLTSTGNNVLKNSARWVIHIATGALGQARYTVETRIGASTFSAVAVNLSRTYFWMGNPLPPQNLPLTETYQFLGDPRHCPYSDVKWNHRYSWNFAAPAPLVGATGFDRYDGLWNGVGMDVHNLYGVVRRALLRSHSLWSSITGWSYYYVGIGGEIGYDAENDFPNGIPIDGKPWAGSTGGVQEITNGNGTSVHNRARVISKRDESWWGRYWLGELFPDTDYNVWVASGNLPVGTGNFFRRRYNDDSDDDVDMDEPIKRTGSRGAPAFFNGSESGGDGNWFTHRGADGNTADITASSGTALSNDFNFPLLASMSAARPFDIDSNDGGSQPGNWTQPELQAARTRLQTWETWYEPGSGVSSTDFDSSALVRVVSGADAAGVVVNGLSPQSNFGAAQIAKLCAIGLMRGFMSMGAPGITEGRIPQVPLVVISTPSPTSEYNNPTTIDVVWSSSWTRWDGQSYTSQYAPGFSDGMALSYNVKISLDNGRTWRMANTTVSAAPGVYSSAFATAGTSLTWNVSDTAVFPTGEYLVRLEVYRVNRPQHYSYHVRRVFIKR